MATGERTFVTAEQSTNKQVRTLIPAGDYDLKLRTASAQIKKSDRPGSQPRVSVMIEVLGSATSEGGKNRMVFHDFYTSLEPMKNGALITNNEDQVVALSRALGEPWRFTVTGSIGKTGQQIDILNPQQLLKLLVAKDGTVVRGHIKIDPAKDGYEARNRVVRFYEEEEAASNVSDMFGTDAQDDSVGTPGEVTFA